LKFCKAALKNTVITDRWRHPKKSSSHCWWKFKNFAIHLYRTVWLSETLWLPQQLGIIYYVQTAVAEDISSMFFQHFCYLLYIVLIQLFAARTNKL